MEKSKTILIFGIGIFSWLGLSTFRFFIQRIIELIVFRCDISSLSIFIIQNFLYVFILIYGMSAVLKLLQNGKYDLKKLFRIILYSFIAVQIACFLLPFVQEFILNDNYRIHSRRYYMDMTGLFYQISVFIIEIGIYIYLGTLIFTNYKKIGNI